MRGDRLRPVLRKKQKTGVRESGRRSFLYLDLAVLVGVDDRRFPPLAALGDAVAIGAVDVAVDEVSGLVLVQQVVEALEAPVGEGVEVVQSPGGGVGEQDVEAAAAADLQSQPPDAHGHLPLGVHAQTVFIPVGAAQAQDAHPVLDHDPVLRAQAALRRRGEKGVVVVAPHVYQRAVGHGDQKFQVFPLQVAAGQDQAEPVQAAGLIVIVVSGRGDVGHGQDVHGASSPVPGRAPVTPAIHTVALPVSVSSE